MADLKDTAAEEGAQETAQASMPSLPRSNMYGTRHYNDAMEASVQRDPSSGDGVGRLPRLKSSGDRRIPYITRPVDHD